ncbi:GRAM domain-containing protein 2A isoform X2 [Choloepus didactylus]|nr:GRAM domain-containing protein 2A isoform X2 [Choloepus didactylus]XP_037689445.1 GRAM domain-containing protein 2A isoform X2 [Choloepus didactylus]
MHGKTTSPKSPVSCTERGDRVPEPPDYSLHWPEGFKSEEIKKSSREGTLLSKYDQQYHKLFKDIPLEEVVLKVCSCALQRDLLLQGRLYISPNWLCFHASLFGKDIKVVIPVVSVQTIKKHKMARLLPNGLAITTNTSKKYVFVSLLSRDSVYDMLRRVCTHLQPSSKKSLSVREFPEAPECESLEVLIPEMKWRKVCPASRSLSLPNNIPCIPRASVDSTDSFFPIRKPPGSGEFRGLFHGNACKDQAFPSPNSTKRAHHSLRASKNCFFLSANPTWKVMRGGGCARSWTGVLPAPGACLTALPLQSTLFVRTSWRRSPRATRS